MTFAEFEFWKACAVRLSSYDLAAADVGAEADKMVAEYRKRAATVTDFYDEGLYTEGRTS